MKNKKLKKPFFASFLEKQIQDPEAVKGGATTPITDLVTVPTKDTITTPTFDNVSTPTNDNVTMKYPSDSDEAGELDSL